MLTATRGLPLDVSPCQVLSYNFFLLSNKEWEILFFTEERAESTWESSSGYFWERDAEAVLVAVPRRGVASRAW